MANTWRSLKWRPIQEVSYGMPLIGEPVQGTHTTGTRTRETVTKDPWEGTHFKGPLHGTTSR